MLYTSLTMKAFISLGLLLIALVSLCLAWRQHKELATDIQNRDWISFGARLGIIGVITVTVTLMFCKGLDL